MPTSTANPKVDDRLQRTTRWRDEFTLLRDIALASGLDEDVKWGSPCYTLDGKNVALIHGFKDYCAVLFFKGALMKDPLGRLIQQTDAVQAARQMRFTSAAEIGRSREVLLAYIHEAAAIEASGQKVAFKSTQAFEVPAEFQSALDGDLALKKAFEALTPGRQRAYLLHIGSAKQAKTRAARVEKSAPRILEGKGLDD